MGGRIILRKNCVKFSGAGKQDASRFLDQTFRRLHWTNVQVERNKALS